MEILQNCMYFEASECRETGMELEIQLFKLYLYSSWTRYIFVYILIQEIQIFTYQMCTDEKMSKLCGEAHQHC